MLPAKPWSWVRPTRSAWLALYSLSLLTACDTDSGSVARGKELFEAHCKVCHAQGLNGAPILGNRKMWRDRLPQGADVLIQHAIKGYGLMPAKGGGTELSDEQVAEVVRYMISEVQ